MRAASAQSWRVFDLVYTGREGGLRYENGPGLRLSGTPRLAGRGQRSDAPGSLLLDCERVAGDGDGVGALAVDAQHER